MNSDGLKPAQASPLIEETRPRALAILHRGPRRLCKESLALFLRVSNVCIKALRLLFLHHAKSTMVNVDEHTLRRTCTSRDTQWPVP
jgi:hypothetical protein